jgi:hypothetical protein
MVMVIYVNTTDISWIEELIKNKTMAWSVYLTIIYLLAEHGPQDFVDNISAKEVVQNRLIRYYYANHPFGRYFIGKSEEFYKAFQAGKEFIEKLFKHDIISRASKDLKVYVIGFKAHNIFRTEKGLEILGPKHFGFDIEYTPIENAIEKIKNYRL